MRYFLYISYNGANYCGWQKQPNGISIQEKVEEALKIRIGQEISITGAGRTDAGVNAYNLPAHCDFEALDSYKLEQIRRGINGILPHDIHVRSIRPVRDDAHARFDAISRTYRYFVAPERDPFIGPFVLPCRGTLDFEAMNDAAKLLLGKNDFTSFTKLHNDAKNNICTIFEAYWGSTSYPGVWAFKICANRFLRNMVRTIVGTLLDIGNGERCCEDISKILEGKDRSLASATAKPTPLILSDVQYPQDTFLTLY